jgi:hypothetical protein
MEPIAAFYEATLMAFYNQSREDHGLGAAAAAPPRGAHAAAEGAHVAFEGAHAVSGEARSAAPPAAPCYFMTYPDTLGGAAAQLQATLSGGGDGTKGMGGGKMGGGGGGVERHNPLKLLGRMNAWLHRRCRAMLLDAGVRPRLAALQARLRARAGGNGGSADGDGGERECSSSADGDADRGADRFDAPPVSAVLVSYPDACSCIVAHLLGAVLVEANGNPWVQAPVGVPQVRVGFERQREWGRHRTGRGLGGGAVSPAARPPRRSRPQRRAAPRHPRSAPLPPSSCRASRPRSCAPPGLPAPATRCSGRCCTPWASRCRAPRGEACGPRSACPRRAWRRAPRPHCAPAPPRGRAPCVSG